jgi:hypothetical protein
MENKKNNLSQRFSKWVTRYLRVTQKKKSHSNSKLKVGTAS